MLKVLAALGVLQLAATAFLIARFDEANNRLALAEAAIAAIPDAPAISSPQSSRPVAARVTNNALDAEVMRRIIREEVALVRMAPNSTRASSVAVAPPPIAHDPAKSAAVRQDFSKLLAMGKVETRDLDRFLELAAALPEVDRKKALSDLSLAINDGRIEGQF